jgi:hypothetical protein
MPTANVRAVGAARGAALLLLALAACGGPPAGPVNGAAALEHVRQLSVVIGERPFGSDGLAKAADYISAEIRKLGLDPQRHEVVDEPSGKTIRNVYTQIGGKNAETGPILMLGAHYDSKLCSGHADAAHNFKFVGAIDGGGAPAVLLELARVIKAQTPPLEVSVWLYWIDAEESIDFQWNSERALIGSKAFTKWLGKEKVLPRVKAFVLLDLLGDANYKVDRDGNSHKELQEIFARAGEKLGCSDRMYQFPGARELQWYRDNGRPWGITDDHNVFTDCGVPSVLLIDFEHRIGKQRWQEMNPNSSPPDAEGYAQWWHTAEDTIDRMSADSLAFAGNLVCAALPDLQAFVLKKR